MRKLLLIALGLVVLVLAVTAGVVAYFVSRVDSEEVRAIIAQRLADAIGRPVTIGGALDLQLGLTPSITIDHITIGNAPWGSRPVMVELRRFEAALELLPLLSRKVSISRLKVSGASAWLETDANGRGNWELTGGGSGKLPWFYQVEAEQLRIAYRDGITGTAHQLDIDRATAIAERRDGPVTLVLVGKLDGDKVDLGGTFGPLTALIEPRGNALTLDLTGHALGVRLAAKGTITEPHALHGITLALSAGGGDTKVLSRLLNRPLTDLGSWRISGRLDDRSGRLALRGILGNLGARETAKLSVKGDIDDLLATRGSRGLRLDLAFEGAEIERIGEFTGGQLPALGQYEGTARVEETAGKYVVSELDVALGNRERIAILARGSVSDPAAPEGPAGVLLDVLLEGQATEALSRVVGVPVPAMGSFRASGRVTGSGRAAAVEGLTIKIGSSDVVGDARLDLSGQVPRIEARLGSGRLNLMEWRSTAPVPARRRTRLFDATPIDAAWTRAVDAAVRLEVQELTTPELSAADVALDIDLKSGVFTVRPSAARMFEGRINFDGALDGRSAVPQLRVKLVARGLDANRLSRAFGATERVDGLLDATFELSGRGGTMQALVGSLNGRAATTLTNGRIANRQIEWLAADLVRVLMPGTGELDTPVSCAVAQFDLKNGLATAQALLLDTRRVTVTGSGTVNLANEVLALRLDPKPKEVSLLSLANPVLVGGTLSDPTFRPDPAGVAKGLGGAALGLAMGPIGLLIPFVSAGTGDNNPCAKLLSSPKR
jgi:uncharacterized protein involved in outer membrane biogenesis